MNVYHILNNIIIIFNNNNIYLLKNNDAVLYNDIYITLTVYKLVGTYEIT